MKGLQQVKPVQSKHFQTQGRHQRNPLDVLIASLNIAYMFTVDFEQILVC